MGVGHLLPLLNQECTYLTHDVWDIIGMGQWLRWPEAPDLDSGQRRDETFSLYMCLLRWVFLHLVCGVCEWVSLALCVSMTLWGTFAGCDWGQCLSVSAWSGACGGVCERVRALWGLRVRVGVGVVHLHPSPRAFVSGVVSDRGELLSKCLCPFVGVFCCFGCAGGDVLIKDV